MSTIYTPIIREILAATGSTHDPRHIEAWMREGHATLDGLSRPEFVAEVDIAIVCIASVGTDASESLAQAHSL